jgi:hypothetical protein
MPELTAKSIRRKGRDPIFGLNVLRTESKADLAQLLAEISQDIEPKNSIEKIYVSDIVSYTWEVMRYRRVKTGLLNNALRIALTKILNDIRLPAALNPSHGWLIADGLSYRWLFDKEDRRQVLSLLQEAGFDESAIEAGAYRLVADDLEKADRMIHSAQAGRDKALRSIAKYRKSFADRLRRSSDRTLAADEVPSIANDAEN